MAYLQHGMNGWGWREQRLAWKRIEHLCQIHFIATSKSNRLVGQMSSQPQEAYSFRSCSLFLLTA
eukprot:scaffold391_cov412-Pavlova_lutheri.AAC.13